MRVHPHGMYVRPPGALRPVLLVKEHPVEPARVRQGLSRLDLDLDLCPSLSDADLALISCLLAPTLASLSLSLLPFSLLSQQPYEVNKPQLNCYANNSTVVLGYSCNSLPSCSSFSPSSPSAPPPPSPPRPPSPLSSTPLPPQSPPPTTSPPPTHHPHSLDPAPAPITSTTPPSLSTT